MTDEGQNIDRKSLKVVTGKNPRWKELSKDCVCFANASGGVILLGIEDGETDPPQGQTIPKGLLEKIRKRMSELTVNVTSVPMLKTSSSGAEYIEMQISRSHAPASTTDGRFYIRIVDDCKPLIGDEIQRLISDRSAQPWETLISLHIPCDRVDQDKLADFARGIRESERVKPSVKEKSDQELLDHYLLADGLFLTNLGVLCIGRRTDRARLGTAPVIQFIKYDDFGQKVNKLLWDDYDLSPIEMVENVWREIPDFRETYEVTVGLFRQQLSAFDEKVVRELLVNALVHRPYTQRGDIFLNLHPERLEVVNPGLLPLGVTPQNVLHASRRRNDGLARIFHDLKLMEREGSGFDLMYERLLTGGRPAPVLTEGDDSVCVIIKRRITKPEVIRLLNEVDRRFQLTQRERITMGLLAQFEGLTAHELMEKLKVPSTDALKSWLGRLADLGLVQGTGRTRAKRYFIPPELLDIVGVRLKTTLARIEPHRLSELVLEDIRRYPNSRISDIHERIGNEISRSRLKRALAALVEQGEIVMEGTRGGASYHLPN